MANSQSMSWLKKKEAKEDTSQSSQDEDNTVEEGGFGDTGIKFGECESTPIIPEVAVSTGEESDVNVLSLNGKCYQFCSEKKSWLERGNGMIKLNDEVGCSGDTTDFSKSRLIMRGNGTHRLILNTSLWSSMVLEKAGQKAVRVSAKHFETSEVHIYLIKSNETEIRKLHGAIDFRIRDLKSKESSTVSEQQPHSESFNSTGSSTNEKFEKDCKV